MKGGERRMYWMTGFLGLAMALAPFVLGYASNPVALWTSLLVGGATLFVSYIEGVQNGHEQWEYWTAAILGVIAIAAPFVLGFSYNAGAMWTTVIGGALIALFASARLRVGES